MRPKIIDRNDFVKNLAGIIVLAIAAAVVPFFVPEALVWILGMAFLFIILAVSWNLVTGYAGQVNLGLTVFVGLGAYTSALLHVRKRLAGTPFEFLVDSPPIPVPLSMLVGGIVAALVGLGIGVITLRLKGWYLALVTAVLPIAFVQSTYVWKDVFGGEEGFTTTAALGATTLEKYYASLALMVVFLVLMLLINNSKLSLRLKALREEPELAEAVGLDTVKLKLIAFTISSFIAGVGGAAIVHYRLVANNDLYDIPLMLLIILAVVIGGIGTFWGPVLGGLLTYTLKFWWLKGFVFDLALSTGLPINDDVILYALLIILALIAPRGLWPIISEKMGRISLALAPRQKIGNRV